MTIHMTRRDFLNGMLLGAGALLLELPAPRSLFAQSHPLPGFGGTGDYASSNGNTAAVINAFKKIESGDYASLIGDAVDTGETYDLVIVGGGLSGLGAAYEFNTSSAKQAKCLILENHPIFGGAAKRNEFLVQGERLIGPQASNAFGVIDRPGIPGYDIYSELGIPTEFEYGDLPSGLKPLEFDSTNFGYRLWFDSKSIGHYYAGQEKDSPGKWVSGFWENKLAGTPYPEKVRKAFLTWKNISDRQYDGSDYSRWLDSMTYKDYLEKILKLDPEITKYADPVLASVVGLGCDVISAYAARQVSMPGFPEFQGHRSLRNSHWHSFPGGNDAFARCLMKALIPDAIEGSKSFEDIHNGRVRFPVLDRGTNKVRLRLGSSVVRVEQGNSSVLGKNVTVTYLQEGRLYRLKARTVVMACGGRLSRKVVSGLPVSHAEAYAQFHVSPILVANVALTNWRFLYQLGLTACKWSGGFGFGCNIRKPMHIGDYRPPLHPDKPTLLTFYISFHQPGLPIEEQGESGRKRLLSTSYAEFEALIIGQMKQLFSGGGFQEDSDIAGIVLNRWTYAYVNPQPGFYFSKDSTPAPRDIIRKPFGRIAFAHAELNGHQHWVAAVDEGRRAAKQAIELLQ
ncbi:MAG: NAD(P)/FAD-dependent oxidoreductase [Nitrospirae bacterium]|nr:MAG: NAD(P)/FAD-dependent oxidoreductase [Nitrospirota bacterium]